MRISFPEISDDLTELFGAADARSLQPTEISPEIIPVHRLHAFRLLRQIAVRNLLGAAGVPNVDSAAVPADRYWYLLGAGMEHNDAAARDSWIQLKDPGGVVIALGTLLALPTSTRFGIRGPLIVPPKWAISAEVITIAAGATVRLRVALLELNLQDAAPH